MVLGNSVQKLYVFYLKEKCVLDEVSMKYFQQRLWGIIKSLGDRQFIVTLVE